VLFAYLYAVLFGIGYAVTASLIPAMMSDRFRGPHFGAIFGWARSAVRSERARRVARRRIFDATGSYAIAFTRGVATAGAAVCMWIIRLPPRLRPGAA